MLEIHPDLKPLSANLKRINIGKELFDDEFGYLLEENHLDEAWKYSKEEWTANNSLSMLEPIFKKYTGSYIIALNVAYTYFIQSGDHKYKMIFNLFCKLGLVYFTENNNSNVDLKKIIDILKQLNIIEGETIKEIESSIPNDKLNIVSTNEFINSAQMNQVKKYQIFISSTYIDLIEERQAAVEAILQKGHIPAGMELFSASDKSQWEVIKKWIDDSDIYLLLLGGRYGSLNNSTNKSYTEMEYEYAISKGKPLFALILDDAIIDNKPREVTKDYDLKDNRYIAFKNNISKKMCSFPKNIDQIKLNINQSLDSIIHDKKDSLIGWIKGALETKAPEKKK